MINILKTKGKIFVLAAAMIVVALLAASAAGYAAETDGSSDINRCKLKKSTFFWTVDTSYKTGYFGGITLDLEETQKLDPTVQEDAQYIYANIGGELVIRVTPREGYVLQSLECQPRYMQFQLLSEGCYKVSGLWDEAVILAVFEEETRQHQLEVVNSAYGDVDLGTNTYQFTAHQGAYLAEVVVNGESKGSITQWTIQTGDHIIVRFAKEGETWQETEQLDSLNRTAYEKTIAKVEATTIKAQTVKVSGKKIKLQWKKSSGCMVDYFEVYRSTSKKTLGKGKAVYQTKSGGAKVYTDTKSLKKGKKYYYKLRGVRIVNGKKIYTQWSNVACRIAK